MNRRSFLRSLAGAVVASRVVYAFAPPGGWALNNGVYTLLGGSRGGCKTMVTRLPRENDFLRVPGELDAALAARIGHRLRRNREWFFDGDDL